MFPVTKMNEKENKKKNDKAFRVKRESLYLTAIYNGWGFREVFGDKRGFGEGWGFREYLQLRWGFGELSPLSRTTIHSFSRIIGPWERRVILCQTCGKLLGLTLFKLVPVVLVYSGVHFYISECSFLQ
jgi:hypothetical protein